MQRDKLQGLSLPSLEESPGSEARKKAGRYHYLMETPDGEGMSVQENELSTFLRQYGTPAGAEIIGR